MDNRQFPRSETRQFMRFRKIQGDNLTDISHLVNISKSGLQFSARQPYPPESIIEMEIEGSHDRRPLTLKGKVVWTRQSNEVGVYCSGVQFHQVPNELLDVIVQMLAEDSSEVSEYS